MVKFILRNFEPQVYPQIYPRTPKLLVQLLIKLHQTIRMVHFLRFFCKSLQFCLIAKKRHSDNI